MLKRLAAGAAALCAAALLLVCWRVLAYRPVIVAGPAVAPRLDGVPASGWPRTEGMRLHVFNTGMLRISPILVGDAARWRPAPAFVLEHPRRGLVVYDAGIGPDVARRGRAALPLVLRLLIDVRARPDRLLPEQMRGAGLDPGRVSAVVLSHAHFDHIGPVGAFPQATYYAAAGIRENHRAERSAAVARPLDDVPPARWRELSLQGAPRFATFDGGRDLFGDGSVVLAPGWGHTREDLLALLLLPRGPVLLAGDAVEDREWLRSDDVQRVPDVPERAAAVRNQVRALLRADPGVLLVPGHDLGAVPTDRPDVVLHGPELFSLDAWGTD